MKVQGKEKGEQRPRTLMTLFGQLRRWSLGLTLAVSISLMTVAGYRALICSPFLSLQRIEVTTQGRVDRREIIEWARLSPGGSLITLNLGKIRADIEAHPWVERAWVERAFPHTLRIRIKERRPVAKLVLDHGTFLLDATGGLFAPWDPSLREDLIPLVGLRQADLQEDPQACQRVVRAALDLLETCREHLQTEIKEVGLNPDRGLRLALDGGPSDIRLGFGELNERIRRLDRILSHLAKEGQIRKAQWIDLRGPGRATVKFEG